MSDTLCSLQISNTVLSQSFANTWWDEYGFHLSDFDRLLEEEKTQKKEAFQNFLQKLSATIFDDLNLSLLRGDYVIDPDFRLAVEALDNNLKSIQPPTPDSDELQELLENELNEGFIKRLNLAMQLYVTFLSHVERRVKLSTREYLFGWDSLVGPNPVEANLQNDRELAFFICNKDVAQFDHFLTLPSDYFNELKAYRQRLDKDLNIKKYSSVLRSKIDFLMAKIVLRRIHVKKIQEQKTADLYVMESLQDRQVNIKELADETFTEEIHFIRNHYELRENWKAQISEKVNDFKNKSLLSLTMRQLHQLVKFYKDIVPDYPSLKDLRIEVERRWRKSLEDRNVYNTYCYAVSLIYTINNEFSRLLQQENTTEEAVDLLYEEVVRIAERTNINNFFPQVRYIKFLVEQLEASRDQRGLFINLEKARASIEKCEKLYNRYQTNIEWSKENYNYVFLLPAEDSVYPVKNREVGHVFVSSSFLLPLVKQKYMQELEEYSGKLVAFKTQISVLENVKPEIEKLQNLKTELEAQKKAFSEQQQDIKNSQIRSLEIIGIFTAIVTFVASAIPSFKFIESALQALLFMLTLSSGLGFFVYMLLLILKGDNGWSGEQKGFVKFLVAVCAISWVGLLIFNKQLSVKSHEAENQYKVELRMPPDTSGSMTLPLKADTIKSSNGAREIIAPTFQKTAKGKKSSVQN